MGSCAILCHFEQCKNLPHKARFSLQRCSFGADLSYVSDFVFQMDRSNQPGVYSQSYPEGLCWEMLLYPVFHFFSPSAFYLKAERSGLSLPGYDYLLSAHRSPAHLVWMTSYTSVMIFISEMRCSPWKSASCKLSNLISTFPSPIISCADMLW